MALTHSVRAAADGGCTGRPSLHTPARRIQTRSYKYNTVSRGVSLGLSERRMDFCLAREGEGVTGADGGPDYPLPPPVPVSQYTLHTTHKACRQSAGHGTVKPEHRGTLHTRRNSVLLSLETQMLVSKYISQSQFYKMTRANTRASNKQKLDMVLLCILII